MPGITVANRTLQRAIARSTDPDWRMRTSDGAWPRVNILKRKDATFICRHILGPTQLDRRQRFVGDRTTAFERNVERLKLLSCPAHADTKDETPAGDDIQVCRDSSDLKRMPIRKDRYCGVNLDTRRHAC